MSDVTLSHVVAQMFAIAQTVHTLWKLLLEFSVNPFDTLQLSFRHIEDVHEDFSW